MNRAVLTLFAGVVATSAMLLSHANAQPALGTPGAGPSPARPAVCPEGRAANGACANPGLALSGRDRGVIYTQPRLSMTAPPRTLPSGGLASDRVFRAPNNPITDADREVDILLRR